MKKALIQLLIVLGLEIVLTCLIPHTKALMFDALDLKSHDVYLGMVFYFGVVVGLDLIQSLKPVSIMRLTNSKRMAVIHHYSPHNTHPQYSQRIQEDSKFYVLYNITVKSEYFISFFIVVYLIIQNLNYPILTLTALSYATLCIALAYLFKPPLIRTEKALQTFETNYREELRVTLKNSPDALNQALRWNLLSAYWKFGYASLTKLQTGVMLVAPYVVLVPLYLQNQITLGSIMEQSAIFSLIVVNASVVVSLFPSLMLSKASKERLDELKTYSKD